MRSVKEAVEKILQRMLNKNQSQHRKNLYQRYQDIINNYNRETDRVAIEKTFEELMILVKDISEEESRGIKEGLSEEYLAIFDLLCEQKENLNTKARNKVKKVAQSLLIEIKQQLAKIENWQQKESTQAQIKRMIHDYLYDEKKGLPEEYEIEEIDQYSNVIYLHIFQQYSAKNVA